MEKPNVEKPNVEKPNVEKPNVEKPNVLAPVIHLTTTEKFDKINCSTKAVLKEIKNLDTHKATGPDRIPAIALKIAAPELAVPLTRFFRKSFDDGTVPSAWKCAHVTPIPKPGSPSDPQNYRPIALYVSHF